MRVIFPSDMLNNKIVDDFFAEEFEQYNGSHALWDSYNEKLLTFGDVTDEVFLYRGWILSMSEYKKLEQKVKSRGATLLVSSEQYENSQFAQNWLDKFTKLTPRTVVVPFDADDETILNAVKSLDSDTYFVKGCSKSVGIFEQMIAHNADEVLHNVAILRDFTNIDSDPFILIREFEDWSDTEYRSWWFNGELVFINNHSKRNTEDVSVIIDDSLSEFLNNTVMPVVASLDQPVFTVDVVKSVNGDWRVVECGNGQVCSPRGVTFSEIMRGTSLDNA